MPIDFGKLDAGTSSDTVLSPREIFSLLPARDAKYSYLRDVQAEVLDGWFERRTEKDIVVRMNTGSGKTVVGLLILKSCLNEDNGPAAYVTADKYLANQVRQEATALGIEIVDDPRDPQYQRGKAVFVGNVYKLINGWSVFGVGDAGIKIPIGSVIIDDVHACLDSTESQFTMTFDATIPEYQEVYNVLKHLLHQQSSVGAYELEAHEPGKFMMVPFWGWAEKMDDLVPLLHKLRESEQTRFSWPLIKDFLPLCRCVIGEGKIEISPPCIPISIIRSFAAASRRIFMSATLSDDSVLVSHFDVGSDAISRAITPTLASDIGDRMVLVPQELNATIQDSDLMAFLKELSQSYNVVVIVPSYYRATFWADAADATLSADNLRQGVERLKNGHVGLVVLVNKYDGIDLPDNACRVLVIDGLPDVRRGIDRVEQMFLSDTNLMLARQIQRIEQGMGRGVRANDDYCVVFLMGRTLVGSLYAKGAIDLFTPATRAQIDLSNTLSGQLRGKGLPAIGEAIESSLKRDPDWLKASKSVLARLKYEAEGYVSPFVMAQRGAFDKAAVGNHNEAIAILQEIVDKEQNPVLCGWLKLQLATYMNSVDPVGAQRVLKSGVSENKYITRPVDGIQYTRLSSAGRNQATRCCEFLCNGHDDPNRSIIEINALADALIFQPDTSVSFEEAMKGVAFYLGFEGQRPESEFGRGPDVLWSIGELKYFVIECKNGATTDLVSKRYCDQLGGSVNWFGEQYDSSCSCTPLLIHPNHICERAASPHPEMRVVTKELLPLLADAVRAFVTAAMTSKAYSKPDELHKLLIRKKLTADLMLSAFTVAAQVER